MNETLSITASSVKLTSRNRLWTKKAPSVETHRVGAVIVMSRIRLVGRAGTKIHRVLKRFFE